MPSAEEFDPILDDEIVYRRVPVSQGWVLERGVSMNAFKPRPDDATGISLYRARFVSLEQAAKGLSKQGYYLLVLRAGDLRGWDRNRAEAIRRLARPCRDTKPVVSKARIRRLLQLVAPLGIITAKHVNVVEPLAGHVEQVDLILVMPPFVR